MYTDRSDTLHVSAEMGQRHARSMRFMRRCLDTCHRDARMLYLTKVAGHWPLTCEQAHYMHVVEHMMRLTRGIFSRSVHASS